MNFNDIINALEKGSAFDLYRLHCAISIMMEDPKKMAAIKAYLTPGMPIAYFDSGKNKLIDAVVVEVRRTRLLVQNREDNARWLVRFYQLNIENVNVNLDSNNAKTGSLNKVNLRVGDRVGWVSSKCHEELFGEVIKLNPKKAHIGVADGKVWIVPYTMLFPVLEGDESEDKSSGLLLEGEML